MEQAYLNLYFGYAELFVPTLVAEHGFRGAKVPKPASGCILLEVASNPGFQKLLAKISVDPTNENYRDCILHPVKPGNPDEWFFDPAWGNRNRTAASAN
jgi:hypothetical protein